MGRNKQLRKHIAGQMRVVVRHQEKIEKEIRKPAPDLDLIRKWERDIDKAQRLMRDLEEKLVR